jgi:hypothetical protein
VRLRVVAPIVLICLGAVGCTSGGSDGPSTSPAPSTPSTQVAVTTPPVTSTVPTTSPPTSPSVATTGPREQPSPTLAPAGTKNTSAGASAFAAYWFETLSWSYETTTSRLFRASSAPSCIECSRFAGIFDKQKQAGNHFVGGLIHATNFQLVNTDGHDGATQAFDVTYRQASVRVLNSGGKVIAQEPGFRKEVRRIWLARAGRGWLVVDTKEVIFK